VCTPLSLVVCAGFDAAAAFAKQAMQACCPTLTEASSGTGTPYNAQDADTLVAVVDALGNSATVLLGVLAKCGDGDAEYGPCTDVCVGRVSLHTLCLCCVGNFTSPRCARTRLLAA
jgi:hypothetical protein